MIGLFDEDGARLAITYNGQTWNDPDDDPTETVEVNIVIPRTQYVSISDPNPTGTGTQVFESRKLARIITLAGVIRSQTLAGLFDKMADLAAATDPDKLSHENPDEVGFLALDFSTPTADTANYATGYVPSRYYARPRGIVEPQISQFSGFAALWSVDFFLKDPRRYLQTTSSKTGAGDADNTLADFRSWPTITITMAGAGSATYQLARAVTGFDTKTLKLDLSGLVNGDVVVVDMETKTLEVNGTSTPSRFNSDTQFFEIEPDTNTLSITNGTNATTVVSWRRAFSG